MRRALAIALIAVVGVLAAPAAASSASGSQHAPNTEPAMDPVTVDYECLVTFPGGTNVVGLSYSFTAGAVALGPLGLVSAHAVQPPVITPNPQFSTSVRDVTVAYRLPAGAAHVKYRLSGGMDLGPAGATVARFGDVLTVRAAGPFTAGEPFQLPRLDVLVVSTTVGDVDVTTGGTSFEDPSFGWTLTDHQDVERPLRCNPPTPVLFSRTAVIER